MRHFPGTAATALAGSVARAGAALATAAVVLLVGLAVHAPLAAADEGHAQARIGGDVFVAGGAPTVREPVTGDLFVGGGSVDVEAAVAGDTLGGAGRLQLNGDVGDSVHAAAGQFILNGHVGGHLRAAGGQLVLGPRSQVGGDVSIAGGQMRLLGTVGGDVVAAGGRLTIDGVVGGDVVASTGQVELGPNARIAGQLRHRGGSVQRDPAAQVAGGVESWWPATKAPPPEASPAAARAAPASRIVPAWPWTLAAVLLAAVLLGVLPGFQARVAGTLRQRPALSVTLGAAWLVGVPLALLLLLLTVIGIPITLLCAVVYVVLLPLAYVSTAIALGDWTLRAWRDEAIAPWAWRVAAAAAVLVLLSQALRVPWLGVTVVALVVLAGLGALGLQLRRRPAQAR